MADDRTDANLKESYNDGKVSVVTTLPNMGGLRIQGSWMSNYFGSMKAMENVAQLYHSYLDEICLVSMQVTCCQSSFGYQCKNGIENGTK